VKTHFFDYELPEELIATHPAPRRDDARLLVLGQDGTEHRSVRDFVELVPPGALVVLNDTRVRRARAFTARRGSGGKVELFFLRSFGVEDGGQSERWEALGKASQPLRVGTVLEAPGLEAEVVERSDGGMLTMSVLAAGGVEAWLERHGHVPIPPYLRRSDDEVDAERYQTVYARRTGSAAAPTAGLHLTPEILEGLQRRQVDIGRVELEIGLGTFRPVEVDDLDRHPMHAERVRVSAELAERVARARARGGPVVAVGTTVVRALETAADEPRGHVRLFSSETRLLIQPGYEFRVVDMLLTNFHQPKSTLLALVSAFGGYSRVRAAYREAIASGYRFLSYGDAMWMPVRAHAQGCAASGGP
jgi:S-adenosylmethionine:tRNA ribosyltransferase-isomerase